MAVLETCIVCFGVLLRIIFLYTGVPQWLETKNEVVTPLTAWERVEEGLALKRSYISPYTGDVFHETPLLLKMFEVITRIPNLNKCFFIMLDIWVGMLLWAIANKFARYMLYKQTKEYKEYDSTAVSQILRAKDMKSLPAVALAVHFFNPYTLSVCLARSTAAVNNLSVMLMIYYTLNDNIFLSTLFLALATYQSFYPFILCLPVALYFYQRSCGNTPSYSSSSAISMYIKTFVLLFVWFSLLLSASYFIEGSWSFLQSTFLFTLSVPDLSPNVGLFWYFFTEMFEHFRVFFVCVFQINAVIYSIPLAVRLKKDPVFYLYIMLFLICIFKSYPSYGDVGLSLTLLPLWRHTFSYMRNAFVVTCMYICCTVFAPILWHLWIYSGSANANFYFAITLAFSTAQIFLVTDLLFAYLKREFDLYKGTVHKLPNGDKTQVILE